MCTNSKMMLTKEVRHETYPRILSRKSLKPYKLFRDLNRGGKTKEKSKAVTASKVREEAATGAGGPGEAGAM